MNPITSKLFAIPIAIASIIMAYSCSTEEGNVSISTDRVQEQVIDPAPTTTVAPTTTMAPEPIEEPKETQVLPLTVDEARAMYGKCGEWRELALMIGWPAEEWFTLSHVLYRESRCNVGSHNKTDPMSGSRGLMQINGYWCRPSKWTQAGWLQDRGVLSTCEDLYDPEVNLRAGLHIWMYGEEKHSCGWRGPWATPCDRYTSFIPHP
jgi:hypothetical protein